LPRGRERAKRANLGDVRFAVFFLDVLNHLATAILAEIDIDIRRLAATQIENRSNSKSYSSGQTWLRYSE